MTTGAIRGRVSKNPRPFVAEVQEAVCEHFDVVMRDLVGTDRHAWIVRPRQIGYYVARELTALSLPQLGRHFGNRDHTTLVHGISTIGRMIERIPEIDADVNAVRLILERKIAERVGMAEVA